MEISHLSSYQSDRWSCVKIKWGLLCPGGCTQASFSGCLCVQVVRAKERLEEELSIQTPEDKQQKTETWRLASFLSPSSVNYNPIKAPFLFFSHDFVAFVGKFRFHRQKHTHRFIVQAL